MKKEIIIAVIIGILIGSIVAVMAVNLPKLTTGIKIQQSPISPTPSISKISETISNLSLSFDPNIDNSISEEKTINVTGTTLPKQLVFLETAYDQKAINADDSGKFSAKIDLSEGTNMIYGSVFDEDGNSISKTLTVYYTSEKL